MLCIKCKREINNNLLRCNYCHTKVQTVCPVCKTLNPLKAEYCSNCSLQLIKYCPECKSANLPSAIECRKCHHDFREDRLPKPPEKDGIPIYSESKSLDVLETDSAYSMFKNHEVHLETALEETKPEENGTTAVQDSDLEFKKLPDVPEEPLDENNSGLINIDPELNFNLDLETGLLPEPQEDVSPEFVPDTKVNTTLDESNINEDYADDLLSDNIEPSGVLGEFEQEENVPLIQIEEEHDEVSASENEVVEEKTEEQNKEIEVEKVGDALPLTEEEICETLDKEMSEYDQITCKRIIQDAITKTGKKIIGLSGEEGLGKSTILKYLYADLGKMGYSWLHGECSANSQISPFGIFQEMLLSIFNLPNFSTLTTDFQKEVKHLLANNLPTFSPVEIADLFNFLYPSLSAYFEDILVNKETTFKLLEKTVLELSMQAKLIIAIDDFDMIDGASYEFLVYFINQNYLSENLKLVISYKDKRITQGYFYSDKIPENEYQDVFLAKLNYDQAKKLAKIMLNKTNPMPEKLFEEIYKNSKGNSAYIEQMLVLLNENGAFYLEEKKLCYKTTEVEEKLPKNLYEIMTTRLELLKKKSDVVYKALCTAAIMGSKFNIKLFEHVMKMEFEDFKKLVQILVNYAYITQINESIFVFKNTLLWKFIYEKAKQDDDFIKQNEKIFDTINNFILSSNALKALVAQNLNQKLLALNIWTENVKLCAYLGDEHLWVLSQKQCLKIAQEVNPENNKIIINNIQERMGKLLYLSKPVESIGYLSHAVSQAIQIDNKPKIIELSGYLSQSCYATGNYHGVIEAVDTVLKIIDKPEYALESALIKYKKLKALFCIGNAEEIYNIANNEIIPYVEQALSKLIPTKNISMETIYAIWLECNLMVANALVSQGSSKAFSALNLIDEIIYKNKVENKSYILRVALTKALAYTMQGEIIKSEGILIEINQQTSTEIVEPEIISQWNFINILNKLFKREWSNIKEDLFSVVTFANNYNDVLVKNLLKTFLGKVLQEEDNLSKALDIYNEQVTVFAKEKIAIGALLSWYYIAKITLVTDGSEKAMDIAQKALEVAKNPKISNYFFMVLYKRLIAEIFIIQGDMEAAKMYIEKALMLVKTYDMKLQKVLLYQLYAKYLEEMLQKKPQHKYNYAQNAMNTYKKAMSLLKDLELPAIETELQTNIASFKAFCQLNKINL